MGTQSIKFATVDEAFILDLQNERSLLKKILSGEISPPSSYPPTSYRDRLREVNNELNKRYITLKGL